MLSPAAQSPLPMVETSPAAGSHAGGSHGRKPLAAGKAAAFSDLLAPGARDPVTPPAREKGPSGHDGASASSPSPTKDTPPADDCGEDERPDAAAQAQQSMAVAVPQAPPPPAAPGSAEVGAEAETDLAGVTVAGTGNVPEGSAGPQDTPAAPATASADAPGPAEGEAPPAAAPGMPAPPVPPLHQRTPNIVAVPGPAVGATANAVGERAAVHVASDTGAQGRFPKPIAPKQQGGEANLGAVKDAAADAAPETPLEAKPADAALATEAAVAPRPDALAEIRPGGEPRTAIPPAPQPMSSPAVPVGLAEVAVVIAARFKGGESRFQIRLDPADLGRIDVDLAVDEGGQATTTLTVERMDTLDLLQRDSRALERALGAAGFKTDQASLQFNLRDPGQGGTGFQPGEGHAGDHGASRRVLFAAARDEAGVPRAPAAGPYPNRLPRLGGLDIRV